MLCVVVVRIGRRIQYTATILCFVVVRIGRRIQYTATTPRQVNRFNGSGLMSRRWIMKQGKILRGSFLALIIRYAYFTV